MSITYEHPLNDSLRTCLKLEHCFAAFDQTTTQSDIWASRQSLRYLIEIMHLTDRPDLRSKLSQQVQAHLESLTPLQQKPGVDGKMLRALLQELQQFAQQLHQQHGKFGQLLRESEFLGNLNTRAHQPGGLNDLSHPSYQLWLQQTPEYRKHQIQHWYQEFKPLQAMISRLLQLLRDQHDAQNVIAEQGFFQTALDPSRAHQLIRVIVPLEAHSFPEISIGRHRLVIRLMTPNGDKRPQQYTNDLPITLQFCSPLCTDA